MARIACPKCGVESMADLTFCLNCGATLRSQHIVDMRPTIEADSHFRPSGSSPGQPEAYTARTSYRSGVLEAKSAMERRMGVLRMPVVDLLPEGGGSGGGRRDLTFVATVAIAILLVIVVVILAIIIATYI